MQGWVPRHWELRTLWPDPGILRRVLITKAAAPSGSRHRWLCHTAWPPGSESPPRDVSLLLAQGESSWGGASVHFQGQAGRSLRSLFMLEGDNIPGTCHLLIVSISVLKKREWAERQQAFQRWVLPTLRSCSEFAIIERTFWVYGPSSKLGVIRAHLQNPHRSVTRVFAQHSVPHGWEQSGVQRSPPHSRPRPAVPAAPWGPPGAGPEGSDAQGCPQDARDVRERTSRSGSLFLWPCCWCDLKETAPDFPTPVPHLQSGSDNSVSCDAGRHGHSEESDR